jgi:hypothetical protein
MRNLAISQAVIVNAKCAKAKIPGKINIVML